MRSTTHPDQAPFPPTPIIPVTLYTRQGCHLCEQALALLHRLALEMRLHIQEVDIDANPLLFNRYWDRIPVVQINSETLELPWLSEKSLRETLERERSHNL
ncbi:MAG: glutaredoxin family protein [Chloroflexi bacterium]|nr:glutaredoxin family protein [Chloroflexota bacterium]